jgi:hypothetical protein
VLEETDTLRLVFRFCSTVDAKGERDVDGKKQRETGKPASKSSDTDDSYALRLLLNKLSPSPPLLFLKNQHLPPSLALLHPIPDLLPLYVPSPALSLPLLLPLKLDLLPSLLSLFLLSLALHPAELEEFFFEAADLVETGLHSGVESGEFRVGGVAGGRGRSSSGSVADGGASEGGVKGRSAREAVGVECGSGGSERLRAETTSAPRGRGGFDG